MPNLERNDVNMTYHVAQSKRNTIKTQLMTCGLRHPMKLVPFATRVRMDVKAFPSRPSVPLLITNSQRRNSILFMTAMKYQWITSSENLFSRSRWHSQISFPTVLMFFLVTQVRNCEDESRILIDLHRITYLFIMLLAVEIAEGTGGIFLKILNSPPVLHLPLSVEVRLILTFTSTLRHFSLLNSRIFFFIYLPAQLTFLF
ncbi:hypothetical protein T08_10720 [Trichinella sp. T8]|nr:hypothetical protein T08_10720 [Trichinella sp. T8]